MNDGACFRSLLLLLSFHCISHIYIYISRSWLAHPSASLEHGGIHDSSGVSSPSWRKRSDDISIPSAGSKHAAAAPPPAAQCLCELPAAGSAIIILSELSQAHQSHRLCCSPIFFLCSSCWPSKYKAWVMIFWLPFVNWKKRRVYFHSLVKTNIKRFAKTISFLPLFFFLFLVVVVLLVGAYISFTTSGERRENIKKLFFAGKLYTRGKKHNQ